MATMLTLARPFIRDSGLTLLERLRRFPRRPHRFYRAVRRGIAVILRVWLKVYHRFEIIGIDNLPRDCSFVLVANHSSHLDALCMLAALPLCKLHRAFPAAAADYFFVSTPRCAIAVLVTNALPFHRRTHLRQSLDLCRRLLKDDGNILILYPEGTRSTDGRVGTFRPGIGHLLAGTTVPAVPCYLDGAGAALGKRKWFPRPLKIRLTIGTPRAYATKSNDKNGAESISRDLERAVKELSPI
jgi:1-acyl-sn-glycerol-3-phosphate acyltransferase